MARILFLTPQVPYPPHQGTTIRNYNLIANLAANYELHLLSFRQPGDEPPDNSPLPRYCQIIETVPAPRRSTWQRALTTLFHPAPDMALRLASEAFQSRLGMLLERYRYDVIQIEGIEMAPYALWLLNHPLWRSARVKGNQPDIPIGRPRLVFDDHNAEYVLQQRAWETDVRKLTRLHAALYSFIQWRKLCRFERQVCQQVDRVVAVSDADRNALRRLLPGLSVTVVPNGVDLAYYTAYDRQRDPHPPDFGPHALVFTGKMDFRPNIDGVLWFVEKILPLIQEQVPDVHFVIVGKEPQQRVLQLAANPAVTVTGWVPDVRPYIAAAAVYVVPLRMGGGTRLKVPEAMAMGCAIVSTRLGCEGFPLDELEAGDVAALADTPAALAQAVVDLLNDPPRRRRMGQAARRFVASQYGWKAIVPRLKAVYEELGVVARSIEVQAADRPVALPLG